MEAESLARRVLHGTLWIAALNVTSRALGVVRVVALARLLTPHDFGLLGIALVVMSLFEAVSTTGAHLALIQRRQRPNEMFDTAWTVGLIRDALIACVLLLAAPAIGGFFGAPDVIAVVRVMALVPLLRGFTNIGVVELRRELTFRPYTLLHAGGVIADLGVSVSVALWRRDVWALVAGWIALTVAQTLASYVVHPYRPRIRLRRDHLRELYGYGRWIFLSNAIEWALTQGTQGIIARLLGVSALGLYQIGGRLVALPVAQFAEPVAFAAYAKLQESRERAAAAYLRVLAVTAIVAVPVSVGIGLHAEELVALLFGPRWSGAVPIIEIFAVFGVARAIAVTSRPLFQGLGRPSLQTVTAAAELAIVMTLVWPLTRWLGILGPAVAVTAGAVVSVLTAVSVLRGLTGVPMTRLAQSVTMPLLACLPWIAARRWLLEPAGTVPALVGELGVFIALYVSILVSMHRFALYRLDPVIREMLTRWSARHA